MPARLTRAERLAARLTPAARTAIKNAFQSSWGQWFVPNATHWGLRGRLVDMGLLSRRPAQPFRQFGIDVRDVLLRGAGVPLPLSRGDNR